MKVGIITFHSAENHGAFLQTYASCMLIKKSLKNATVGVLDYRPWYLKNTYRLFFPKYEKGISLLKYVRCFAINLIFTPNRLRRKLKFQLCQKKLNLISLKKGTVFLDYVYMGSDQIWNAHITKGIDSNYYGEGNDFQARHKVAYAISMGEFVPKRKQVETIKQYCNKIDAISAREKSVSQVIEKITNKSVEVVLDPTLMIEKEDWEKNARYVRHKKYIVVYQLGENHYIWNDAVKYAEEHGCNIISLNEIGRKKRKETTTKIISAYAADPFEFVGIIRNAEFVFTDSFHGTCFSLIFRREFVTYLGKKRNERIVDLLNSLGIAHRIVEYESQMNRTILKTKIQYDLVVNKLDKMRNKSLHYFERSFGYGTKHE